MKVAGRFIHLATHGAGSGDAIYFAGSSEAEATLSMSEVHELSICAPLVTLSACCTFRGEMRTDGVVGLARAFLASGAQSLLASLWPVDDEGTMELMQSFYK